MAGKTRTKVFLLNNKTCSNILVFHRIYSEGLHVFADGLTQKKFSKKLQFAKKIRKFGDVEETYSSSSSEDECKRKASITFDDGYLDNYELALPVLQKHNLSATFFIASGYLNGGWMWNDGIIEAITKTTKKELDLSALNYGVFNVCLSAEKKTCIDFLLGEIKYLSPSNRTELARHILDVADVDEPKDLMMTSEQIKLMHKAGMEIGGHTVNHPILTSVDKATARREIFENKEYLESLIGEPIYSFAYPNGKPGKDYGPEHVAMVKEAGYSCAVSTAWGRVGPESDPFQLPRFTPWDRNPWKFMLRLLFQRFDNTNCESV